jgi:amino acid permease
MPQTSTTALQLDDGLEEEPPSAQGRLAGRQSQGASLKAGTANLLNTIIGGGILSLPFAFRSAGFFTGAVLVLGMGGMSFYGNVVLIGALRQRPVKSYEELAYEALGRGGWVAFNMANFLNCYGACLSYIIVIGDIVPLVLHELGIAAGVDEARLRSVTLVAVTLFIILPLSAKRSISALKYASGLAIVIYLAFVGVLIGLFVFRGSGSGGGDPHIAMIKGDAAGLLRAVPICAFAFTCQMSLFPIYQETREPTESRMNAMSALAFGIAILIYLTAGALGYALFGEGVHGDVLTDLSAVDSVIVRLARLAFGLSVCLTYPVLSFSARRSLDQLVFKSSVAGNAPPRRLFTETLVLVGSTLVLGLLLQRVEVVFGFVGACASTSLSFLLPAAIHIRLSPRRWPKLRGALFFAVGALLGLLSLAHHSREVFARPEADNHTHRAVGAE